MKTLKKYGIDLSNSNLLSTALTHTSYANEHNCESYERLEFLGDAVLELVSSDYIYKNHNYDEGLMSKNRSLYVCENALYEYATNLGLNRYIKVGHGEEKEGGKYKKAIVADIFEALMGAIYLDLGYATARRTVLNIIVPYIEDPNVVFFSDYSWYNGNVYVEGGEVTNNESIDPEELEMMNYYVNYLERKNDLTLKCDYFKKIKKNTTN